jgi:hypothetical protein
MQFKICIQCKEKYFSLAKNQLYCSDCRKIVNQIQQKHRGKKYRAQNKEEDKQRLKTWREERNSKP